VLGFAVVFTLYGAAFGATGSWLVRWRDPLMRGPGVVVILMGAALLGLVPWLQQTPCSSSSACSWSPGSGCNGCISCKTSPGPSSCPSKRGGRQPPASSFREALTSSGSWDPGAAPPQLPSTSRTAEHAVHSLKHGAVRLTYNPALGADAARLTEQAKGKPYVLLSPDKDQTAPVTATADT
jgi:hypothetical protein